MSKRVKMFNKIFLVLILAITISVVSLTTTQALMGTDKCYTTTTTIDKKTGKKKTTKTWNNAYEGYFTQECASKTWQSQGNVINGGVSASNAKDLIKQMHKWYDGGGQNAVGAAFIVKTMLGKDSKGGGKTITSGEWTDVEARIKALDSSGKIDWSSSINRCTTNSYYQSEHKDDSFYKRDSGCGNDPAIKFSGGYVLDKKCANPLGSLNPLPKPDWKVSVKSQITSSTSPASLLPKDTVTWKHTVTNEGPNDTTSDVKFRYENGGGLGSGSGSNWTFSSGAKKVSYSKDSSQKITSNDAGNLWCRATSATPKSLSDSGRITSSLDPKDKDSACVTIPYKYTLTPSIDNAIAGMIVSEGSTISVVPNVSNAGPTRSKNTQWQISEVVVQPGATIPAAGNLPSAPCVYYSLGVGVSCSVPAAPNSTGSSVFAVDVTVPTTLPTKVITVASDYPVGTRLCYALSVKSRAVFIPAAFDDDYWANSLPICTIIGKKPKVQIWGGDLAVGGLVRTSISIKNIGGLRTFGSWGEYGIFAVNTISGMGSGSAFAGPGLLNATVCGYSTLSFANVRVGGANCTNLPVTIGNYSNLRSIPDVEASFPGDGEVINVDAVVPNDLLVSPGTYMGTRNGDLTINQSDLEPGKSIILKIKGTVTIDGNQIYNPDNKGVKYTNGSQLPQLVIIANKIVIRSTVSTNPLIPITQVDAWLVANNAGKTGRIDTCEKEGITTSDCNNMLTVNGPVMTDHLYLYRTAGSGQSAASSPDGKEHSGDPAEVFNLRPDAYLWAYARATSSGHVQTVHMTELPPRF